LASLAASGVITLEGFSRGQRIPVRRETVVAFLGPALRGPINIPVAVRGIDEFRKRFGSSDQSGDLRQILSQYFDNGGTKAIVIRVCQTSRRNRISLAGQAGPLMLEAVNPGPSEFLRASVDYDGIPEEEADRFNLVIHRLSSPSSFIVEQQEIFSGVSVSPEDPNFIGHLLLNSDLVRVRGQAPDERPESTLRLGDDASTSYVYADTGWQNSEAFTDYDLVGSVTEGTGIFALDRVPVIDLVCIYPGNQGVDIGPVALFAAERYCRSRNAMLLIDPPSQWNSVSAVQKSCREQPTFSPNVMTYFPCPLANDGVDDGVAGKSSLSALGAIAGRIAAEDTRNGIAGALQGRSVALRCRHRLPVSLTDAECAVLEKAGVNALRQTDPGQLALSGLVTFIQGAGIDTDWECLRKRRSALFIIDSIARGTRWAIFESNGPETWLEIGTQIEKFLMELFEAGALSGKTPREAGYVVCGRETNRKAGDAAKAASTKLSFIVGFSLTDGEVLAFRFMHDSDECKVRKIVWQPGIALAS
jgi:hypothetical protein